MVILDEILQEAHKIPGANIKKLNNSPNKYRNSLLSLASEDDIDNSPNKYRNSLLSLASEDDRQQSQ